MPRPTPQPLQEIERLRPLTHEGKAEIQGLVREHGFSLRPTTLTPLPGYPDYGYRLWTSSDRAFRLLLLHDLAPQAHGYQDTLEMYRPDARTSDTFTPLIGALRLERHGLLTDGATRIPHYTVDLAVLDEQPVYRKKGLAQAMYRVMLHQERVRLVSGRLQTPAGRRLWVRLASLPDLVVEGALLIAPGAFEQPAVADRLFGRLGLSSVGRYEYPPDPGLSHIETFHLFTFPVTQATSRQELKSFVRDRYTTLYRAMHPYGRHPQAAPEITDTILIVRAAES